MIRKMLDDADLIMAHELREMGITIAEDIPASATINRGSFVPVGCELRYDQKTKVVYGGLRFKITEAFTWEKEEDGQERSEEHKA